MSKALPFTRICSQDDQSAAYYHYSHSNPDPMLPIPSNLGLEYDRLHIEELFQRLSTKIPFDCCSATTAPITTTSTLTRYPSDSSGQSSQSGISIGDRVYHTQQGGLLSLTLEGSITIVLDAAERLRYISHNVDGEPRLKQKLDPYITVEWFRGLLECIVVAMDQKQRPPQQRPPTTTLNSLILALTSTIIEFIVYPLDDYLDFALDAGVIPVAVMLLGHFDDNDENKSDKVDDGVISTALLTTISQNCPPFKPITNDMIRETACMIIHEMLYQYPLRVIQDGALVVQTINELLNSHNHHRHRHDNNDHNQYEGGQQRNKLQSQSQPSQTIPNLIKYLYSQPSLSQLELGFTDLVDIIFSNPKVLLEKPDDGKNSNNNNQPLFPLPICSASHRFYPEKDFAETGCADWESPNRCDHPLICLVTDVLYHPNQRIIAQGKLLFAVCVDYDMEEGDYADNDDEDDDGNDRNNDGNDEDEDDDHNDPNDNLHNDQNNDMNGPSDTPASTIPDCKCLAMFDRMNTILTLWP